MAQENSPAKQEAVGCRRGAANFEQIRPIYLIICCVAATLLTSCDQFEIPNRAKHEEQATEAVQSGDFPRAVRSFEAVLDGTSKTAAVHYQLGLIYDDKLDDPVSALHHYRRYLRMTDDPQRTGEVQEIVERIELVLATRAADGGIVTKREAARLRNENLALAEKNTVLVDKNKSLESELAAAKKQLTAAQKAAPKSAPKPSIPNPATVEAEKRVGKETRTYTVVKGDTLASISRKFYETPGRWKDIADANYNTLQGTINLQVGQVLIIP